MYWLLGLAIGLIVYGSLYPWHFQMPPGGVSPFGVLLHSWPDRWTIFSLRDAALNVPLYAPVGLLTFLAVARRHSRVAAMSAALGLSLSLTVAMELAQVYVPGRDSSLFDVLCNFAGGMLGALAGRIAQPRWNALARRGAGRLRFGPLLLLGCWIGYQLFPFFPAVGRNRLRMSLHLVLHPQAVSVAAIWIGAAEWFVAALLLRTLLGRLRAGWLAIAACCPALRCFIVSRSLSLDDALGIAAGLLLWLVIAENLKSRAAIGLLASAEALAELAPFRFSAQAAAFSWIPFGASLGSEQGIAAIIVAHKAFDYGAMIWLLRRAGISWPAASLAVALALAALECVQRYLPGRTPEITDSVLALLMGLTLWACDFGRRRGLG